MVNRGEISQSLNCGGSYTIPSGYHNGSGKVTVNSLSSQTSGTAIAANILKDKTAWVNGSKITGTMTDNGAVAPSALGAGGSYTIPAGYHNGSGKVTVSSLATITSGGTVTAASQILSGYKAYSDGTLYTGSMTNRGAQTKTFTPSASSQSYTIPAGYHNGSGKVTCNAVSNLSASNIKKGVTVGGVTGTCNGYVVSTGDLYLRGQNPGNVASTSSSYAVLEAGAIYFTSSIVGMLEVKTAVDFSKYTKINFQLLVTESSQSYVKMTIGTKEKYNYTQWLEKFGEVIVSKSSLMSNFATMSIDVSSVSKSSTFFVQCACYSSSNGSGTTSGVSGIILRIWMS